MFTRLIVRARLSQAQRHRQYILGQINDWTFSRDNSHPESLQRVLAERAIAQLLLPELKQTEKLIGELEARLNRA